MNISDLFDSPLKLLIIAIVVLALFGTTRLPVFARSLGRSMRILKAEVSKSHDDEDEPADGFAQAKPQALLSPQQQQIEELQQQVRQLQQQAASGAQVADAQTNKPG